MIFCSPFVLVPVWLPPRDYHVRTISCGWCLPCSCTVKARVFGEGVKSASGEIAILGCSDHAQNMFGTSFHITYCKQTIALETVRNNAIVFQPLRAIASHELNCMNSCNTTQLLQRHPLRNPPLRQNSQKARAAISSWRYSCDLLVPPLHLWLRCRKSPDLLLVSETPCDFACNFLSLRLCRADLG